MTSPEQLPYPAREHYKFPKIPSEVMRQEFERYGSRKETLYMMIGLREMYKATGFMTAMRKYSEFAVAARADYDESYQPSINSDFYAGALLAVHAGVSVQSHWRKHQILGHDFLADLTHGNPAKADIETGITDWLKTWIAGEENNWAEFLNRTSEAYQRNSAAFAERLYPKSVDGQVNFLAGIAHATNMLSQTTVPMGPPV